MIYFTYSAGRFEYVSKIIDKYTKWTEVLLIQIKREAKTIDHSTKQPSMFGISAGEREKDLDGPSIATLGLFGQTSDD